ncbi:hypothetical protein BH23BAC4_BH23BAC4_17850 [soil metagenome]
MAKIIKPTNLRANLYQILDEVLKTGEPVVVERKGKKIRIEPEVEQDSEGELKPHPGTIVGDAEDLVEISWDKEWTPFI